MARGRDAANHAFKVIVSEVVTGKRSGGMCFAFAEVREPRSSSVAFRLKSFNFFQSQFIHL
jgi:hypothetical protein